jgi:2-methylcitrate dehydratase PrpD
MPTRDNEYYRRAFWIALTTSVALVILASVLWWRLSHAGTASQSSTNSASGSSNAMASPQKTSDSEQGSAEQMQSGNMQETALAPIQLTP